MLGYMTQDEALSHGLTHHGRYYGIPIWIGDPYGEFRIAVKWVPLDPLLTLFTYIEAALNQIWYPDREGTFMFFVGKEIKLKKVKHEK